MRDELLVKVQLVAHDPAWAGAYERQAERIRGALGDRIVLLEHVGSTSIPGIVAKPKIDILLAVPDSADEEAYVPALERAGFRLHIREPDWHEHRLLHRHDADLNLHVFSGGCGELERMVRFRDHLRANAADREVYERTKVELARREWETTQNYADAKTDVVEGIIARASARR